jgi:drug/metabolite transporter (DMT)-like permease
MGAVAVGLVLVSAFLHATWNVLAKRSAEPTAFLYAMSMTGLALYLAPAAFFLARDGLPADALPFMVASAGFETAYLICLGAAYRYGALSLTYPVARGTSVILVPLLAVPLLDERPTAAALAGIATIVAGFVAINALGARARVSEEIEHGRRGLVFALLTGLCIAGYSLVDKAGVQRAHPLVYLFGIFVLQACVLSPYVLKRYRAAVGRAWHFQRRELLIAGVLNVLTYVIVLAAMKLSGSKIGYIVPLRETSIVFATLYGVVMLRERIGRARIVGCGLIATGVLAIALGG